MGPVDRVFADFQDCFCVAPRRRNIIVRRRVRQEAFRLQAVSQLAGIPCRPLRRQHHEGVLLGHRAENDVARPQLAIAAEAVGAIAAALFETVIANNTVVVVSFGRNVALHCVAVPLFSAYLELVVAGCEVVAVVFEFAAQVAGFNA